MFDIKNVVISFIRTYVPVWVGTAFVAIDTWLQSKDLLFVHLDTPAAQGWAVGVAISVYYAAARTIERYWPKLGGWLLGSTAKPVYVKPVEPPPGA